MIGLNSSFLLAEVLLVLLLANRRADEDAAPRLILLLMFLLYEAISKESVNVVVLLRCKSCIDCCNMLVCDEELRHDLSVKSVPVRRIGGSGVSAAEAENSSLYSLTLCCCAATMFDTGGVGRPRSDRPAAAARAFS